MAQARKKPRAPKPLTQEAKQRRDARERKQKAKAAAEKKQQQNKAAAVTGLAAKVGERTWAARLHAILAKVYPKEWGRWHKHEREIEALCRLLGTPPAIAHPDWAELVKAAIDVSWSRDDARKEASEEVGPFVDDDDADETNWWIGYNDAHLHTFDWLMEVLAEPAALAHPRWAELVKHLCAAKEDAISYVSDDAIEPLLVAAQKHPALGTVIPAAKRAFSEAACFQARGRKTATRRPARSR